MTSTSVSVIVDLTLQIMDTEFLVEQNTGATT